MNNKTFKKSIARKLALRVTAGLLVTLFLLLAGIFVSLDREVKEEGLHNLEILVGVYADISAYEARENNRPIDLSYSDNFIYFGDYISYWYPADYIYAYIPDFEKGTITYISVTKKDKSGKISEDHMTGVTVDYVMTDEEMKAWNIPDYLSIEKGDRFFKAIEVSMMVYDSFGNKSMVGVAISHEKLRSNLIEVFIIVALFIFIIIAVFAGLLYLLIRRMVSDPAKRISKSMSDYISGGKRSAIKLEAKENDEFSMMAEAFNKMTEDIDKYIDDIALLGKEKERQQAEVDIAARIQKGILLPENALLRKCSVRAVMKPAKYIGGDFYDYTQVDDTHTMVAVADVSGKGISSAMIMSAAITQMRLFAKMGYSPADILRRVNDNISEENPQMMFVTAFVGIYDSACGIFRYANAGHNLPYHIRKSPELLEGQSGTPLGLFPGEDYPDCEIKLEPGDSIFMYTDGVNEAVNASGEFYGTERLEALLSEAASSSQPDYIESVESSVKEFAGGAEQNDDITMLNLVVRDNPVLELRYDIREFAAIKELLFSSNLPKQMLMDLCVAAEECFVNICSYAFDGPVPEDERIQFFFEYSNRVVMRFSDGGRRFDPRENLPDTDEYDIDNAVGGLGRLIAFTLADSVDYEYKDGRNILTITRTIKN